MKNSNAASSSDTLLLVLNLLKRVGLAPNMTIPQLIALSMCHDISKSLSSLDPGLLYARSASKPEQLSTMEKEGDSSATPTSISDTASFSFSSSSCSDQVNDLLGECIKWTMLVVDLRHTAAALHTTNEISDLIDDVLAELTAAGAQIDCGNSGSSENENSGIEGISDGNSGTNNDGDRADKLPPASHRYAPPAIIFRQAQRALRLLSSESSSLMKRLQATRAYVHVQEAPVPGAEVP